MAAARDRLHDLLTAAGQSPPTVQPSSTTPSATSSPAVPTPALQAVRLRAAWGQDRQEFLRGLGQDYQRLRDDPERWEQYLAQRQEWDALA